MQACAISLVSSIEGNSGCAFKNSGEFCQTAADRGKGLERLTFGQLKVCQAKPSPLISRIKLEFVAKFCFSVL